jgi:glycerate 2-kinase
MEKQLHKLRQDAKTCCRALLRAADAREAVLRHVRLKGEQLILGQVSSPLPPGRKVWILGAGKASAAMAVGIEEILGQRIAGGLVIVKYGHTRPLHFIEVVEAGHPLPDAGSVEGTRRLLQLIQERSEPGDLILLLLSGGGSALMESPATGLSLEDLAAVNALLLASGATIHEFNAVRKHLSAVKGGQLARHLGGRETWSLILSDVPGDDLDTIASGPTVPDTSTFAEAWSVLRRYDLTHRLPAAVSHRFHRGLAAQLPDTPKAGDAVFDGQHHLIVGSNALACRAASEAAAGLGYAVRLRPSQVVSDNGEFAREEMDLAFGIAAALEAAGPPVCCISGGETTVRVTGRGQGGRNQDLVLRCVRDLARLEHPAVFLSLGTDGTDGPTDAAGAVADNLTLIRHESISDRPLQSYLEENDSYGFFDPLGDLVKTGPTGTNVMDVHLLLIGPQP